MKCRCFQPITITRMHWWTTATRRHTTVWKVIKTKIERVIQQESILRRLYKTKQDGTADKLTEDEFACYCQRATAQASHWECFKLRSWVIIPISLWSRILSLIHAGNRGIVAMKKCIRSYVRRPKTDMVIDETAQQYCECQSMQKSPPKVPIPTWYTVHLDFTGPLLTYLVVVDT